MKKINKKTVGRMDSTFFHMVDKKVFKSSSYILEAYVHWHVYMPLVRELSSIVYSPVRTKVRRNLLDESKKNDLPLDLEPTNE